MQSYFAQGLQVQRRRFREDEQSTGEGVKTRQPNPIRFIECVQRNHKPAETGINVHQDTSGLFSEAAWERPLQLATKIQGL